MTIWQADFYHTAPIARNGESISWQLLICDVAGNLVYEQVCPQAQVSSAWLTEQLQSLLIAMPPRVIQVFRPQALNLFNLAGETLGLTIIPTRRTPALKALLKERYGPQALSVESPPPQPLPENLWGEQWRFATLPAADLVESFQDRPIPYLSLPEDLYPVNLGIASDRPITGVIIYAGRQARYLGQWLASIDPVSLSYQALDLEESGGLVLEAGLSDRWILATFRDGEVTQSAKDFEERKAAAQGLHFLLVQPDDSGITDTGFWLLQNL